MKGVGTNDDCIVRILVSRCEIDMVQIKKKFQDLYKTTLVDFLKVCIRKFRISVSLKPKVTKIQL